ncbi:MAG TPA: hypothetical protein VEM93_10550, partial [Actinomycetota bacterium]|nr:hypothetical protein [Actinomycetota bacterium]
GNEHTLTERFRDDGWRIVPSADAGTDNRLWAAAITPATQEAWAVGEFNPHQRGRTLVEQICR